MKPKSRVFVPPIFSPSSTPMYSAAVKVGNTIYVSGQTALDEHGKVVGEGDIEAQAIQVYENLKRVLENAGGKLEDVVKLTIYSLTPDHNPVTRKVKQRYFPKNPPAVTGVIVSRINKTIPGLMMEVEAIAVVDE